MSHPASPRIQGALVGLAVVATAAVFFFILAPLFPKVAHSAVTRPMTAAEIKAELGEYDQKIDCSSLGAPEGWRGYAWIAVDTLTGQPTGVWFRCEP